MHVGGGRHPRDQGAGDSDARLRRNTWWAGIGLVLVMASVSGFVLWSARATASAASQASSAHRLADEYEHARTAADQQQSLLRAYALTPSSSVRLQFDQLSIQFAESLSAVKRGDRRQARAADQALSAHDRYLLVSQELFQAADTSAGVDDIRARDRAANKEYEASEAFIEPAAQIQHERSVAALRRLDELESRNLRLTPLVFVAGLLLTLALTWSTRGHRRQLESVRALAAHDSLHDALTGLPNRTLLSERIENELQAPESTRRGLGLLLIDLDRFKEINDTLGHDYGDGLLTQIGPRLANVVREVDTVARLGGDEFAVLLRQTTSTSAALAIAARLTQALQEPFMVEGVELDIEASIGVVMSGQHGSDASTLLQHADIAMYAAKAQGRDVLVYDPAGNAHSPAKLALLGDLRRAIDRDQLVLYYQPKIDIATGALLSVEALVRWQHPNLGLVFPDEFIPMAEHTGLIGPLTLSVLETALTCARGWADAGIPLQVSVNLSARNLLTDELPVQIRDLLEVHGVPAHLLELEVTESAITSDPVRAAKLLQELSGMGIQISIDDFGAGYTSLGQLTNLPVSELKIDKSFVMTMDEQPSNALIVRSIIELGHNLGLRIVAEGVEDDTALQALSALGCDVAQGYHFTKPLPQNGFEKWREEYRGREGDTAAARANGYAT